MVSALTCSINLFLLHLQPRLNSNIPRNLSPGWAPQLSGLSSNPFQLSHFYLNYSPTMYSYLKKRQRPCCPHNLCTKWGVPKWGISWPISQHYKFLYIWIYYLFTYGYTIYLHIQNYVCTHVFPLFLMDLYLVSTEASGDESRESLTKLPVSIAVLEA